MVDSTVDVDEIITDVEFAIDNWEYLSGEEKNGTLYHLLDLLNTYKEEKGQKEVAADAFIKSYNGYDHEMACPDWSCKGGEYY